MTSILVEWVNEVLTNNVTAESLPADFANGFVLGALLHAHNQLPEFRQLRRECSADATISNFCLLAPALSRLGIPLDAVAAHDIIRSTPKAAARLVYQIKMALGKLNVLATDQPLGAARASLPNLPLRAGKPRYDSATAKIFEETIRRLVEPSNVTLMKKHLRRFDAAGERSIEESDRETTHQRALEAERQRTANRDARLGKHVQESAFRETWDSRGEEQWAANVAKGETRLRRERGFDASATQRIEDRRADRSLTAVQRTKDDLDAFEIRLALSNKDHHLHEEDYPYDDDDEKFIKGLDHRSTALAEKNDRSRGRESRRRAFVAERESSQVLEHHDRVSKQLRGQLTRECEAEAALGAHLVAITGARARAIAESRGHRVEQYETQRLVDVATAAKLAVKDKDALRRVHHAALADRAAQLSAVEAAKQAAISKAADETCRAIVYRVAYMACAVVDLENRLSAGGSLEKQEKGLLPTAQEEWLDAKRVFARSPDCVLGLAESPSVEDDPLNGPSVGGGTVLRLLKPPAELADGPTAPPTWPAKEQAAQAPLDVAEFLAEEDLADYLANENFWHDESVARAARDGLATPAQFRARIAKRAARAEQKRLEAVEAGADLLGGAPKPGEEEDDDDDDEEEDEEPDTLPIDAAPVSGGGPQTLVAHLLGEAVVDARLARQRHAARPSEEEEPLDASRDFPLKICMAGGRTGETAAQLAEKYDLKLFQIDALVDAALEAHSKVAAGAELEASMGDDTRMMAEIGCGLLATLKKGEAVGDGQYAQLAACAIKNLANIKAKGVAPEDGRGWIFGDYPSSASQAAALAAALTGVDPLRPRATRESQASRLAPVAKSVEVAPTLTGVDLFLLLDDDDGGGNHRDDDDDQGHHHPAHLAAHHAAAHNGFKQGLAAFYGHSLRSSAADGDAAFARCSAHVEDLLEKRRVAERQRKEQLKELRAAAARDKVDEAEDELAAATAAGLAIAAEANAAGALEQAALDAAAAEKKKKPTTLSSKKLVTAVTKPAGDLLTADEEQEEEEDPPEVDAGAVLLEEQLKAAVATAKDALAVVEAADPDDIEEVEPPAPTPAPRDVAGDAKGALLAKIFDASEARYKAAAKRSFSALREARAARFAFLAEVRREFAALLARPDERPQATIDAHKAGLAALPAEMLSGDDERDKAELLMRTEELHASLWLQREERSAASDMALAVSLKNETDPSWALKLQLAALVQIEVDRAHASRALLADAQGPLRKRTMAPRSVCEAHEAQPAEQETDLGAVRLRLEADLVLLLGGLRGVGEGTLEPLVQCPFDEEQGQQDLASLPPDVPLPPDLLTEVLERELDPRSTEEEESGKPEVVAKKGAKKDAKKDAKREAVKVEVAEVAEKPDVLTFALVAGRAYLREQGDDATLSSALRSALARLSTRSEGSNDSQ